MFSVGGLTQQVFPVQHLVGAFHSSLKMLVDKGAIVQRQHRSTKTSTQEGPTKCQQKQRNQQTTFTQLQEELGLSHLPANWTRELLPRVCSETEQQYDDRWSTSYVSAETFFENKHGFKSSELDTPHLYKGLFHRQLSASLPQQLAHAHMCKRSSNFTEQRRGFKTKRAETVHALTTTSKGGKNQDSVQAVVDKFFKRFTPAAEKRESIVPGMQSAFDLHHKTDRTAFQTGYLEGQKHGKQSGQQTLGRIQATDSTDTNARAAYDSHRGQHEELDYNSFKAGYYDGYMMAGQSETSKGSTSGQKWANVRKLLLLLVAVYLLFPSVVKTLMQYFQLKIGSEVDVVSSTDVTFDDVRGIAEAKAELEEIVNYLKDPEKYTKLGGKLPKGVLLIGMPGTGKTLLARAVAGEAGVPFYFASGSEFDHVFVGTGAKKIRDMFTEAKMTTPCVIFIDEIDSIGGKRNDSPFHPYARQTINQLLAEMDGFKQNEGIIVLGATNFPKSLDNALTRPGRFDISVNVPTPDVKGRIEILDLYLEKVTISSDVDKEIIARGTVGFTGADISNLVNQAALHAAKLGKEAVDMSDMEFAKDKIVMGPERKSIIIDAKNKEITAFHEGGHALVAYFTKDSKPINKATIMPRGDTLGHVSLLPEKDQWNQTKSQLLAQMDICMGGRVAEELIFGTEQVTTGAGSDFDQATRIARLMVTKFGMSDKLGVMTYGESDEYNTDAAKPSQETQSIIETETRRLIDESYERATYLIKTHSKEHRRLAQALLKYETLTAEDVEKVIKGKKLDIK